MPELKTTTITMNNISKKDMVLINELDLVLEKIHNKASSNLDLRMSIRDFQDEVFNHFNK